MRLLPMQRILFPIAAFAAVAIYLIWWVIYAGIHFNTRYSIRPPGAAAEVQGTTVRLKSLVQAGEVSDANGREPALPDPGTVWVVAHLEIFRHDPAKELPCGAELLGPKGGAGKNRSLKSSAQCHGANSKILLVSPLSLSQSSWCQPVTPTS